MNKSLLITIAIISLITNIYLLINKNLTEKKHGQEFFNLFIKSLKPTPPLFFWDELYLQEPILFKNKYFKKLLRKYLAKQPKIFFSASRLNQSWSDLINWELSKKYLTKLVHE